MIQRLHPAECRSCHAPIFWALTDHGRPMPVDWLPVYDGNVIQIEDNNIQPRVHVLTVGETPAADARRYVSHFTTCEQATQWRTRDTQ